MPSSASHFNHFRPCQSGNKLPSRLRDKDLILLSLYRILFPKALIPEVNAFLYRSNYGDFNFRFYCHSQISLAETRIGLTRKRASTTAYQAFLPVNLRKRWIFWNLPYPLGIADVQQRFMIDLDECGVFVESVNRKDGKSFRSVRVNEPGPYSKSEK